MKRLWIICYFCILTSVYGKTVEPKEVLGFTPGDDRRLASWNQVVDYFKRLSVSSERVKLFEIGRTTMGKPFIYAVISSPENLAKLDSFRRVNKSLADPRKITDKEAESLIAKGKAIVLITCGIHSTEVGSYLSSMLIAYRLASEDTPEIRKILSNTIILLVPSLNPDGVDIVKDWYDRTLGTAFEGTEPPELYHKYTGHDNNRDWYAFTQVETQLTVDKIHNEWHPHIVNDIHQMGAYGARFFVPPYLPPIEPNVPEQIVEAYTELGSFIFDEMNKMGFSGVVKNAIFDIWTPARAYSHYHGGVRILTETASARLASPIKVEFSQLRSSENSNYDPQKASENFPNPWKGGEWKLRDITEYMTTSTFLLLRHASDNREKWLRRFYSIGRQAVRERKKGELFGFIIKGNSPNKQRLINVLIRGGVEVYKTDEGELIEMNQPYAAFAKALLEKQVYPNLKDKNGNPIQPYDVTAHTLSLLYGVEVRELYEPIKLKKRERISKLVETPCNSSSQAKRIAIYKSFVPSMDEGWTRFVFDSNCIRYSSLTNPQIQQMSLKENFDVIVFPDQSPSQILQGFSEGSMPSEYVGGIGAKGIESLRRFVEEGGKLVFLNRSSDFAIEQFDLPVRNVVKGLNRREFFIPGSILQVEADGKKIPIWFENSPVFEVNSSNVKIFARYPQDSNQILLSGWALGTEKINGRAAWVEVELGAGKIVLIGFRPQYRGQSLVTFPLLFNAVLH
ncbi:MAG: M14 family metallopeptidase [Pyrinomonadaceae bacterium]|nr:M14 family metallopeptidase [Pyrinomonadaceae bacterium]MCX7638854.1 M14 family metallopeptidase [Pyrinomonadaceae bacterium]MDW8305010.1 M14 family metallopeptidase [Acidobacteriota bacterium]